MTANPTDTRASIAVLQEQVATIREVTDRNSDALSGEPGGYIGLMSEVALLAKDMKSLMLSVESIGKSVQIIKDANPCRVCEINSIKGDLANIQTEIAAARKKEAEFPNILWLIRYRPRQTIPWLVIVIVSVSALGHVQFEPVFTAIMIALGMSPTMVLSILRIFGK